MNSMLNTPLIVPIYVLQQYVSKYKLPFADMTDKIKAQSHYINFQTRHN